MTISRETLLDYLNDALSAAERERVAAALERDAGLRAELEQLRRLERGLRATFDAIYDARLPAAALGERRMETTRRIRLAPALGMAGALAALLLLAFLWVRADGAAPPQTGGDPQAVGATPTAANPPAQSDPGSTPLPTSEQPTPMPHDPSELTPAPGGPVILPSSTPLPILPGAPEPGAPPQTPGPENLDPPMPLGAAVVTPAPTIDPMTYPSPEDLAATPTPLPTPPLPGFIPPAGQPAGQMTISPTLLFQGAVGGITVTDVAADGPIVYALGEGGAAVSTLYVFDLSRVDSISMLSATPLLQPAQHLALAGGELFVMLPGNVLRIDVSDPAAPKLVETIDQHSVVDATVSADRIYLLESSQPSPNFPADLWLDVFERRPGVKSQEVGGIQFYTRPEAVFVSDRMIYSVGSAGGMDLEDATNAPDTMSVSHLREGGQALAVGGAFAYVGDERQLRVIDFTDPKKPQILGQLPLLAPAREIRLADGLAYVTEAGGAELFDLSDPAAPRLLAGYRSQAEISASAVSGNRLYAAHGGHGLLIFDLPAR